MADTRQGVLWALGKSCLLRSPEHEGDPQRAQEDTRLARFASRAYAAGDVLDGVRVTGYSLASARSTGATYKVPSTVRRIQDDFAPCGGYERVCAACGECEANAGSAPASLGGCSGFLDVFGPRSGALERALQADLDRRGLRAEYARLFVPTTPIFHGLWIRSPLRRPHCDVLLRLLDEPTASDPRDEPLRHFRRALGVAAEGELPLHVELTPVGHTGLGWRTIFAHCPRCKADVPGMRWTKQPDTKHTCDVCGFLFDPAQTFASERSCWDDREHRVSKVLGPEAEVFCLRYLQQQGATQEEAQEVLEQTNGP